MSTPPHSDSMMVPEWDELSALVAKIEAFIATESFDDAARLLEDNLAALWFGLHPSRMASVLEILIQTLPAPPLLLVAAHRILTASEAEREDAYAFLSEVDSDDPQQMFILAMFRMHDLRIQGRVIEALGQAEVIEGLLGKMRFVLDPHGGWCLQASVEIGVAARRAGNVTKAYLIYTQVKLYPATQQYSYLTQAALVKSALIHACLGNVSRENAYLERTQHINR